MEGKKLGGMLESARSIIKQSKADNNPWNWAVDQTKPLCDAANNVQSVDDTFQEHVKTSTLSMAKLLKGDDALSWLTAHHTEILKAIEDVGRQLGEMTAMHFAKLKARAVVVKDKEEKPQARKKAKKA